MQLVLRLELLVIGCHRTKKMLIWIYIGLIPNCVDKDIDHSYFSWAILSKGGRAGAITFLTLCKTQIRETRHDHNTGNYVPYSAKSV